MLTGNKTSKEWQSLIKEIIVLDPDGWDRTNYEYSWEQEEITIQEFFKRVADSTCIYLEGFDIIREKYLSKVY
jgi:hypothetical protein